MLFALPCLPAEHITRAFEQIDAASAPKTQPLVDYVRKQWIDSNVHPPATWSVFKSSMRTNNPIEGLHNKWSERNQRKPGIRFYELVGFLHGEALNVASSYELLSEDKLVAYQRPKTQMFEVITILLR